MFPVVLDLKKVNILLIGDDIATLRRLKLFRDAKIKNFLVYSKNPSEELEELAGSRLVRFYPRKWQVRNFDVVFVADLDNELSRKYYRLAKKCHKLVNVEDKKRFCDFHVPAIVRRGDLLITSSTCGKSPTIARMVKEKLAGIFDESWADKLVRVANLRDKLRKKGADFVEIKEKSEEFIGKEGWF